MKKGSSRLGSPKYKPNGRILDLRTDRVRDEFLMFRRNGYSIQRACYEMNVSRTSMTKWLKEDAEFREMHEDAQAGWRETMEDEADRRAIHGIKKPVFYKGIRVNTETVYSDRLLEFRMRGEMPEKYGSFEGDNRGPSFDVAGAAERLASKLINIATAKDALRKP